MCCWEDLNEEIYCEYQSIEGGPWLPSGFCRSCVEELLKSQYAGYVNSLKTTKCKAEQRRLLQRGPPVNISDAKALPCADSESGEVHALWFMGTGKVHSAKLEGSLLGEERQRFWDEQKAFFIVDEGEEDEEAKK